MTSGEDVHGILAEIATQPIDQWETLLECHFPGRAAMVQQGLLWLRANREKPEDESAPPSLGKSGDERYELKFRLASGTTASVWRAHDRKLGRNVAVKVFDAASDGASLELMEARAACDVISDYVVRVLDVHDAGVRPFIVMELVAEHDAESDEVAIGTSAASCRPQSVDEAARWVMEVARGVRDAHLRNVFHRDLKPHNVLITPISRRARIADFGLALSAANDQRGRTSSLLVKRGPSGPVSIAGTPEYMAPEQARGLPLHLDPLDVDERHTLVGIDVWGLGALAYDLLGGRSPWFAERTSSDEPWEIAASGTTPPSLRRMASGERIPASLRRIVAKAMAPEPTNRYPSAGMVAGELEAFLARRPTSLDRSFAQRAALWCRRNPQLTVTGLVAIVLAAITIVAYVSVRHLQARSAALSERVDQQQAEENTVKTRAAATRAELDKTEAQLQAEQQQLAALEGTLRDEQQTYATLLSAKDKALHDANAATRELVIELAAARTERRVVVSARAETQQLLEVARTDLDRARTERDQAQKERDGARVELEHARADRAQAAKEIARLTAALDAANARLAAAAAASAGSDATSTPPAADASTTRELATGTSPRTGDAGALPRDDAHP